MSRYDEMTYRRCGRSGLKLPLVSLGLWHNFGHDREIDGQRAIIRRAFDLGITHFDLANNYGPPNGAAEENFGRILREDLAGHRDELIVSTKAGYDMWEGPYGEWGSRKYLLASLDQSLARMGLDYVDIFYSHRFDPDTPLEETLGALRHRREERPRAVRRDLVLLRPAHRGGRGDPAQHGHAAADPPAVVLDAQPLDRAPSCSTCSTARASAPSRSRRSRRGCSPASTSTASPRTRAPVRRALPDRGHAHARAPRPHPPAQRDRAGARSVAGADGGRVDRARRARDVSADRRLERRSSSRRTSPRSTTSSSRTEELEAIDRDAIDSGINIWQQSAV